MRRRHVLALNGLAIIALTVAGAIFAYSTLQESLPRRAGTVVLDSLAAEVSLEFDARGVPRIRGQQAADVYRALGFVHAQERFFQMDMNRRAAEGTLAELFGERAAALDREQLPYGFRRRALETMAALPRLHVRWLEAYADGVNAGIADLAGRPPEYWLLGSLPKRWEPEDSLLVAFSLYLLLSENHDFELPQSVMAATMAPELVSFLMPSSMRFDRPQLAGSEDPSGGYQPLPIPGAEIVDLRLDPATTAPSGVVDPPLIGQAASNQWAVAAGRSADGRAILANDPHLDLSLPNLFYRAELFFGDRAVRGVSVPGLPGILIGASDDLAWGATVSYADQSDWIVIELDPDDPSRYLTPEGSEPFSIEQIRSPGGDEPIELRRSRWGPVVAADGLGRPLALQASWLEPGGLNLEILELPFADSVEAGIATLRAWSGPSMSWTLADTSGEIGWVMNGPVAARFGFDGATPVSRADGDIRWQGWQEAPAVRGVEQVLSANNRPLPVGMAEDYGRIWTRSYRAHRIDALLAAGELFAEADFLAMQLDTQAAAYEPFRDLIVEVVRDDDAELLEALELARSWNGRADAGSAAFRLLQHYYRNLLDATIGPLLRPAFETSAGFVYRWPLADEVLLRLLEERPAHLLPATDADWPTLFRRVLAATVESIDRESRHPLTTPWGEVNRLDAAHVFSGLPLLGRMLSLPSDDQAGSAVSLRVAAPDRGAVFRMVVSPAAPEDGVLQMAGGQSGHFLSPNFRDQQTDWINGTATPFLAGPAVERFRLIPATD